MIALPLLWVTAIWGFLERKAYRNANAGIFNIWRNNSNFDSIFSAPYWLPVYFTPSFSYSAFTLGPICTCLWPFSILTLFIALILHIKVCLLILLPWRILCNLSFSFPCFFVPPDVTTCPVSTNGWCLISLAQYNDLIPTFFLNVLMLCACIEHMRLCKFNGLDRCLCFLSLFFITYSLFSFSLIRVQDASKLKCSFLSTWCLHHVYVCIW